MKIFIRSRQKRGSIADCWDSVQLLLDVGIRRPSLIDLENSISLALFLNALLVDSNQDTIRWTIDSTGSFTNKSTFFKLTNGAMRLNYPLLSLIWEFKIPKKSEGFFMVLSL